MNVKENIAPNRHLINSIAFRIPWNIIKAVHSNTDLQLSRGMDRTVDKWINLDKEGKLPLKVIDNLRETYNTYFYHGDKAVSIYKYDKRTIDRIVAVTAILKPEVDHNLINYPYHDAKSDNLLTVKPKLVHIKATEEGKFLTFASVKTVVETVDIDPNELSITVTESSQSKFHKLIGKRTVKKRCYDHIYIRYSDNTIEHRADLGGFFSRNDINDALIDLNRSFIGLISPNMDLTEMKVEKENFFHMIHALYHESTDRTCELGFCVEDVIHLETLRTGDRDLRREVFHMAGVDSVESMDVFRIAVRKVRSIEKGMYEIELYIPGSVSMSGDGSTSFLQYCIISNCLRKMDYDYFIQSMKTCKLDYKKVKEAS